MSVNLTLFFNDNKCVMCGPARGQDCAISGRGGDRRKVLEGEKEPLTILRCPSEMSENPRVRKSQ